MMGSDAPLGKSSESRRPGGAPLPPEVEVSTPGGVLVVDDAGRLRDRSPRCMADTELSELAIGAVVPSALLATADARRFVHDGTPIDALWFARGEQAPEGGLDEREFATMLHRLRNVVSVLVASMDAEEMVSDGPISTQLGTTRRREADRLVDALAGLGHAFAPVGARSFVDLEQVLRRVLDSMRGAARRRGVQLRFEGARDARRGRTGDEALLDAGIRALVTNAIEASKADGEVRIRVEGGPSSVAVHVEDDGPGLIGAARGELGAPFATSKRGALGLGLSVARRAAFVHAGELRVATRAALDGTTATFWLPTAPG